MIERFQRPFDQFGGQLAFRFRNTVEIEVGKLSDQNAAFFAADRSVQRGQQPAEDLQQGGVFRYGFLSRGSYRSFKILSVVTEGRCS